MLASLDLVKKETKGQKEQEVSVGQMGKKLSYFVHKNNCWLLTPLPASKFTPAVRGDVSLLSDCFAANRGVSFGFPKIPPADPDAASGSCRNTNASYYKPRLCPLSCLLGPLYPQAQKCITRFCFSFCNMRARVSCSSVTFRHLIEGSCT